MDARAVMDPAALAAELASLPPDTNRKNIILRTVWILLAFSTIIMFARIYVKCKTVRRIYYDDALMVVAMLMGYAHASSITRACETGLGRHIFYLTDHERATTLRAGFFSLVWGFLSPLAGRLGFCTFLLFVAGMDPLIKKWPLWTVMILQVLINVTSILVLFLQCGKQLDIIWNPAKAALLTEVCWNPDIQSDYNYFAGSFNTVTDLFLTILPAVIIHHTKMSLRAKLGLAFLLCLSVLAMIASIVKTYEARVLSEYLDYTYDLVPYIIWISIELNVVITVASIPLLRPLFKGLGTRLHTLVPLRKPIRTHSKPKEGAPIESHQLSSVFTKSKSRIGTRASSMSSEEHILAVEEPGGITRTVEVEISYSPNDTPFVHAALVGLIQGELMAGRR